MRQSRSFGRFRSTRRHDRLDGGLTKEAAGD
jgi:hypothetical protein